MYDFFLITSIGIPVTRLKAAPMCIPIASGVTILLDRFTSPTLATSKVLAPSVFVDIILGNSAIVLAQLSVLVLFVFAVLPLMHPLRKIKENISKTASSLFMNASEVFRIYLFLFRHA
jgi:hypothetical protein